MRQLKGLKPLTAIDLFSGCGGMSYGFELAGIETKLAVDNWPDALETFAYNHPNSEILNFDLGKSQLDELLTKLPQVDIVFGGPPCQGFSISGKRDPQDPRNLLYKGFLEVVAKVRPKVFVMENVPNLAAMDQGRLIAEIENDFISLGYKLSRSILLASDFGVPQNRKRLFLVGTLSKKQFSFPSSTTGEIETKVTCLDALSDLPETSANDGDRYPGAPKSDFQKMMRKNSEKLYNHQITNHSDQTVHIISMVPDGGNYKNLPIEYQSTRKVNIAWT